MGFFAAIGSAYANVFDATGRARRSEFWWFFLFQVLVSFAAQIGLGIYAIGDPAALVALSDKEMMELWLTQNSDLAWIAGYLFAGQLLFLWVPNLTLTIRRLHDTNRSGWFMFMPLVALILSILGMFFFAAGAAVSRGAIAIVIAFALIPLAASIWYFVVLCLPGTHGGNRFGPDPIPDRRAPPPAHPAFAPKLTGADARAFEAMRKREAQDYYRSKVLPSIQRPEAQ